MLRYVIIITFLVVHFITSAQVRNLKFEHLSSDDGLSENNVYCIFKDSYGFMWFGTNDGLNRFDGYEFRVFRPISDYPGSISSNSIREINEDSRGNLLVGTIGGGLNVFLRKEERFVSYMRETKDKKPILNNNVYAICSIGEDFFWIGTDNGVSIFHSTKGVVTNIQNTSDSKYLSGKKVRSIKLVADSLVWVGYESGGIDIFTKKAKRVASLRTCDNPKTSIQEDNRGNVWVGTWGNGLFKVNPQDLSFRHYFPHPNNFNSISSNNISRNSIVIDKMSRIWVGTWESGVNEILTNTDSINYIIKHIAEKGNPNSLSDNFILSTYIDDNDILWIGTRGNGINRLDLFPKKFKNYVAALSQLKNTKINCLHEDLDGNIWMGSKSGGIQILDPNTGIFSSFEKDSIIQKTSISRIIQDKNGTFWIGTVGEGLISYNLKTEKIQLFNSKNSRLPNDVISTILVDNFNNIWIATDQGHLQILDQKTKKIHSIKLSDNSNDENLVQVLYKDSEGTIWAGTRLEGLFTIMPVLDFESMAIDNYRHNPEDETSISHNNIYSIYEDTSANIWVGTASGGLNKLDTKQGTFTLYNEAHGLPNKLINSIVEDNNGDLWLSMGQGILRFNPNNETLRFFDRRDGLVTDLFYQNSYLKTSAGILYFGGDNGVVSVNPNRIMLNYSEPELLITDFKILNKSIRYLNKRKKEISNGLPTYLTNQINLTYKDYLFSFEFAALNYNSPTKCLYEYKLEGFDENWLTTDAYNRIATYTNLRDGVYTFKVRATNSDGIWMQSPVEVKVRINPPFWESWWFILFVVVFIASSIVIGVLYRIKKLELANLKLEATVKRRTQEIEAKNQKIEEQLQELKVLNSTKDKFFSIIAHDLKSPFNALIGFSSILKNKYFEMTDERKMNILDLINKTSGQMFELLVNLLNWARTQSGQITFEPQQNGVLDMVKKTVHLLEGNAKEKGIDIKIEFFQNFTVWCDSNMIMTVFRNVLSNAIKYSNPNSKILITAFELGNSISISIADSGVGMTREDVNKLFHIDRYESTPGTNNEQGTGLGLIVCQEFIKTHKGEIKIFSSKGQGTTVSIILPTDELHDNTRNF